MLASLTEHPFEVEIRGVPRPRWSGVVRDAPPAARADDHRTLQGVAMLVVRTVRSATTTPAVAAIAILAASVLLFAACNGTSTPVDGAPTATAATVDGVTPATGPATPADGRATTSADPIWGTIDNEWMNLGGPAPDCPVELPPVVDISLATSVLYPGQVRGDYKAHGGFRFDGLEPDDVEVRSPIDGIALRGARYLASGEMQYTIDLVHPCGLMVRLGHLRELSPEWTAHFESYPPPIELDSRSTSFAPAIPVRTGDLIAISVGIYETHNTFIDIGMYDLRQGNAASQDPAWLAEHHNDTAPYGICWFDRHGPEVEAVILALPPADANMGRTSDYCVAE
jgi:hypothetical protein